MTEAIRGLSETDLRAIAGALRSGRLSPPFTRVGLQRCGAAGDPGAIAEEMQALVDDGMTPEHLAMLLETLAEARQQAKEAGETVELVWTGPEPAGSASRDTSVVVPELFSNASESVLIAGYAVFQGRAIFRSLAERMEKLPELRVQMFLNVGRDHGDTSAASEILQRFAHDFRTRQWPGQRMPEVYYDPRALEPDPSKRASLHAKCIVVDRQVAFVSSANFTEAAQIRNIEAGVLVRSRSFASSLADHFETLTRDGAFGRLPGF